MNTCYFDALGTALEDASEEIRSKRCFTRKMELDWSKEFSEFKGVFL